MRHILSFLILIHLGLLLFSCTKDVGKTSRTDTFVPGDLGAVSSSSGSSNGSGSVNTGGQSGVITAGEWKDLDHWNFWNELLRRDTISSLPSHWQFFTNHRVAVQLKDKAGKLLHDALIHFVYNNTTISARTDNSGMAEFFPGLHDEAFNGAPFTLSAEYLGNSYPLGSFQASSAQISASIPVTKQAANTVDIAFVVDATGSMGDEITYLQSELYDVINRAGAQLPGREIRMGSVFYRDIGDDYVTKPFAFTNDPNSLIQFVKAQSAGGGGDFPEAADQGLETAVENLNWSDHAINRILFLILDAPPHDGQEQLDRLRKVVDEAQAKGIRIIPISASGIDRSTEFILRFLAVSTNSTYVFITNDSGIGNPHLIPTVGTYTVEYLNNLMIRLITKYGQDND